MIFSRNYICAVIAANGRCSRPILTTSLRTCDRGVFAETGLRSSKAGLKATRLRGKHQAGKRLAGGRPQL